MSADFLSSQVPADLVAAYRATLYTVDMPSGIITLQVDQRSEALAALFQIVGTSCAAYLTAYNPYSHAASLEQNIAARRALVNDLRAGNLHWLRGAAIDPTSKWSPEPSLLILGIDPDAAFDLACKYKQNGFMCCSSDAVPRLVLTR